MQNEKSNAQNVPTDEQLRLEEHLRVRRYEEFQLTEAISPSLGLDVVPQEGYRTNCPILMGTTESLLAIEAAVSREKLFDVFLSLLPQLGKSVEVILESSHKSEAMEDRHFRRRRIERTILESHCCLYENLLMEDGCTGITVVSRSRPRVVRFDEHKLLTNYSTDLMAGEKVMRQYEIPYNPALKLITDGEHLHSTEEEFERTFQELCDCVGATELPSD